jgi:hypothetical protein
MAGKRVRIAINVNTLGEPVATSFAASINVIAPRSLGIQWSLNASRVMMTMERASIGNGGHGD